MAKTFQIGPMPVDDLEPILRKAAYDAAMNSALVDHITPRTWHAPTWTNPKAFRGCQAEWQGRFLRAKRLVEAFGVEYEPTSEEETLTVWWRHKKQGAVGNEWNPDYDNPEPSYRGVVHAEACRAAADRVVRRWRAVL